MHPTHVASRTRTAVSGLGRRREIPTLVAVVRERSYGVDMGSLVCRSHSQDRARARLKRLPASAVAVIVLALDHRPMWIEALGLGNVVVVKVVVESKGCDRVA